MSGAAEHPYHLGIEPSVWFRAKVALRTASVNRIPLKTMIKIINFSNWNTCFTNTDAQGKADTDMDRELGNEIATEVDMSEKELEWGRERERGREERKWSYESSYGIVWVNVSRLRWIRSMYVMHVTTCTISEHACGDMSEATNTYSFVKFIYLFDWLIILEFFFFFSDDAPYQSKSINSEIIIKEKRRQNVRLE